MHALALSAALPPQAQSWRLEHEKGAIELMRSLTVASPDMRWSLINSNKDNGNKELSQHKSLAGYGALDLQSTRHREGFVSLHLRLQA